MCKRLGGIYGQLASALCKRKVSPALLAEQVKQVEALLAQYKNLLSTLTGNQ